MKTDRATKLVSNPAELAAAYGPTRSKNISLRLMKCASSYFPSSDIFAFYNAYKLSSLLCPLCISFTSRILFMPIRARSPALFSASCRKPSFSRLQPPHVVLYGGLHIHVLPRTETRRQVEVDVSMSTPLSLNWCQYYWVTALCTGPGTCMFLDVISVRLSQLYA